ncbi:MAG: N-acetylglucosamine-6-phosphate deacetylase [Bacteroidetes bacterium]|nr:N-acetylglucosamine-6-phosphate deacetylase [Bacteroidota bacterium]
MKFIINNGKIITPDNIIQNGSVLIENGYIKDIFEYALTLDDVSTFNAGGLFVSPGFVDLHVHGGGGHDFMDASAEAMREIALTHYRHGTTSMMPTTLSSTLESLNNMLESYRNFSRLDDSGMKWLGVHIEGPYFAMDQRGAQDARFIRKPDAKEYNYLLDKFSCIARWSVAPELNGALEMGNVLHNKGVIASIAHTDAVYSDVEMAVKNGYSLVTHLYSGMNGVTRRNAYRYAGVVEASFLIDSLDVEIIADGRHLPVPLLQLVYKIKGADKIALITDAIRPAGTDAITSVLGSKESGVAVIIEDHVAKLPDRSSFAGSVATMDFLVKTMWKEAGIPLTEVIRMAATTPARIAAINKEYGSIAIGKKANLVFFDEEVRVKYIFNEKEIITIG